jgi:hypothetical protein
MYFNFRAFFRTAYLSFFDWRNPPSRLTYKRLIFLVGFFLIFPIVQLFNAICLLLDEILFPGYRKVELEKPVFIVGNPRSGTTFMHRIMAKDEDRFFCFQTWEIIFPAVTQKITLSLLGRADRLLGSIFRKALKRLESRLFRNFNKMHHISLFSPEEDDNLLIHTFSHINLIWLFPFFEEFKWVEQLDQLSRPGDRKRIMDFYKKCIMRQAYFKGNRGHFLSKSPSASSRIGSLYEHFPGCKIIYMVRNPLEVIPSMVNMAHEIWHSTINIKGRYPFQDQVYEFIKYNYTYPLDRFELEPKSAYAFIRYDDLVRQPMQTIQTACQRLGLELDKKFLRILEQEEEKTKNYKSGHVYSIDQTHFAREQIISDLRDIFDRFGFDISL